MIDETYLIAEGLGNPKARTILECREKKIPFATTIN